MRRGRGQREGKIHARARCSVSALAVPAVFIFAWGRLLRLRVRVRCKLYLHIGPRHAPSLPQHWATLFHTLRLCCHITMLSPTHVSSAGEEE